MTKSANGETATVISQPSVTLGDRAVSLLRTLVVAVITVAVVYYAVISVHWVLACDSPIMHYVTFLMHHGFRPYVDISDNNMPGSYYTEAIAMRIFGAGDIGWRIYDFFLLAILTAGLTLIAKPYHWVAGIFAGGLFIILHGAEGPAYAAEREEILAVLLVLGYLAMFQAVRRSKPWLMVILGLMCGLAASIKPTFLPLPFALLALMTLVLIRRKISPWPYVGWALLGFIAVFAVDIGYLWHYHVIKQFLFVVRTVTPTYVSMFRETIRHQASVIFPRDMRLLPILVVAAALSMGIRHVRWTWEKWAITLGAAFGLFSYFFQGKAFLTHRYTFLILFFLLAGFELFDALQQRGWPRALSSLALIVLMVWTVPHEMRATPARDWRPDPLDTALQRLGGADTLQGKVQCFDMVFGCFGSVYHLGIVENAGFTGDLLFFTEHDTAASLYYKRWFWRVAQENPATVFVMTNQWLGRDNGYERLNTWPEFNTYLARNYTLVVEHEFLNPGPPQPDSNRFRIYIRNGTPLLAKAQALAASGQL